MAPHPLVAADAVALAVAHLGAHPDVTAELGAAGRIQRNWPPYPRLVVTQQAGSDRDLRWVVDTLLQVEALGDLDGSSGSEKLRRILYTGLAALAELPDLAPVAGRPVVTNVASVSGASPMPLPNGQPRWVSTVRLTLHPPRGAS